MLLSDELYEIGGNASKHYTDQENGLIGFRMWKACIKRMTLIANTAENDTLFVTEIRRCKLAWINAVTRLEKDGNTIFEHVGFESMWNKQLADKVGYKFIYGVFTKIDEKVNININN